MYFNELCRQEATYVTASAQLLSFISASAYAVPRFKSAKFILSPRPRQKQKVTFYHVYITFDDDGAGLFARFSI